MVGAGGRVGGATPAKVDAELTARQVQSHSSTVRRVRVVAAQPEMGCVIPHGHLPIGAGLRKAVGCRNEEGDRVSRRDLVQTDRGREQGCLFAGRRHALHSLSGRASPFN